VYQAMNTRKYGPGVATVDDIIVALGATWDDWAAAVRAVQTDAALKDEHAERTQHQEEILDNLRRNLPVKGRKVHLATIKHLDKIAKATGAHSGEAMMAAVALWVKRAEFAGVDATMVPRILPDAARKKRLAEAGKAQKGASIAAKQPVKYRTTGSRKK